MTGSTIFSGSVTNVEKLQLEDLETIKAEIVAEGTEPVTPEPKRRGPRKKKQEEELLEFVSPELVQEIVAFPFDYAAKRRGDHWKLKDDEKKKIAELTARVANKWLPEWLARYSDEINLTVFLSFAFYTRWQIDQMLIQEATTKPNVPIEDMPNPAVQ